MDEEEFDGTLVLEQLAAIGKLEAFFEAIDADDVGRAVALMQQASVDKAEIGIVIRKIEENANEH